MIAALAFLLQLAGFAALAATMHATPASLRIGPTRRVAMRRIGWIALAVSLASVFLSGRPALAFVTATGIATVAAALVLGVVSFARKPRVRARGHAGERLPRS